MKMPAFDDGAWARLARPTPATASRCTQWSENKEVAGAFLAFLQSRSA